MTATDKPKPYQEAGIDFLSRNARAILADDTGLGKSMQMIRAADKAGHGRLLVLCPAIGRVSWRLQLDIWQTRARPVRYFPDDFEHSVLPDGDLALIVTYEWLAEKRRASRLLKALRGATVFDALILDECHYLKNPAANRTRIVYGRGGVLEYVATAWAASATLTPNHAGELYPHLRALLPDVLSALFRQNLPTPHQFERRFCQIANTPFGPKVTGNNRNTVPELVKALDPYILRRTKAEVLSELDPVRCVELPFEVTANDDDGKVDQALQRTIETVDLIDGDDELIMQTLRNLAFKSEHVATRRRALGLLKIEPAVAWIEHFLSSNPQSKLVTFAHHRDVIELLSGHVALSAYKPVTIYGGTPAGRKGELVHAFQTDPSVRLFVGQTTAAGTSITLTAASDVLLLEPDWTPVNNYQAISRCHRIGQNNAVTAHFAYASGTIDQTIARILRRKAGDIAQLFGSAPAGFT